MRGGAAPAIPIEEPEISVEPNQAPGFPPSQVPSSEVYSGATTTTAFAVPPSVQQTSSELPPAQESYDTTTYSYVQPGAPHQQPKQVGSMTYTIPPGGGSVMPTQPGQTITYSIPPGGGSVMPAQPGQTITYSVPPGGGSVIPSSQPGQSVVYTSTTVPPPAIQTVQQGAVTTVGLNRNLGRTSVSMPCPFCKNQTMTRAREQFDECTIVAIVLLVLFIWPLFWIPMISPGVSANSRLLGNISPCISRLIFSA